MSKKETCPKAENINSSIMSVAIVAASVWNVDPEAILTMKRKLIIPE